MPPLLAVRFVGVCVRRCSSEPSDFPKDGMAGYLREQGIRSADERLGERVGDDRALLRSDPFEKER